MPEEQEEQAVQEQVNLSHYMTLQILQSAGKNCLLHVGLFHSFTYRSN